ncbi:hypothetical protein JD844_004376 [Phrynosoma platyrhinos]|uniref:Transmembrane protein 182 n=1 Tax=Phrynosoma platyrhinos TaxID=52577 RepID=A0ABQ7TND1_PHRPL|nr:hypothetical protein JD844_004376 [Phrynosoma platyrhinos]
MIGDGAIRIRMKFSIFFFSASQAHPKHCMHGYLFPMPIALGPYPHPSYDATAGKFNSEEEDALFCWNHIYSFSLFQTGGLFALLIFMFVMWKEFAADLPKYILLERSERCLDDTPVNVYYGWSFMFAAAGVPLVFLSGLLFYLVGYSILKEMA